MVGLFLQSGYALLPSQPHHRVSSRLTRNLILFVARHGGTGRGTRSMRSMAGLSPRVRGNLARTMPSMAARGSIPACAGEPTPRGAAAGPQWVYPRVCGGTIASVSLPDIARGLSPRVRGNPR